MAVWKLRKDKAPAEAAGTQEAAAEEAAAPADIHGLSTPIHSNGTQPEAFSDGGPVPGLPEFDSDSELHFADLDFDDDRAKQIASAPDPVSTPAGEPLTLIDYTATESEPADSWFLGASEMQPELPGAQDAAVYEMPPIEAAPPADFPPAYAPAFMDDGLGIPTVAPFVLDAPLPAPPPAAAPRLVVRFGRLSATFDVVKDVTTIGRPDSSLHYYPDIEIEMDDAVSRRHAEIVKRPGGCCIVDTGSTNGTLLNGERLPAHEERLLAHGDRIKVGDRTEITFE